MLVSNCLLPVKKVLVAQSCQTPCDPMDCQSPLSMGFSRQEYCSGLPFSSPGDLSDSRIELRSALKAYSLPSEPLGKQAALMYLNVMRSLTLPPPQLINIFCGPFHFSE